jgi:cyanophycinase
VQFPVALVDDCSTPGQDESLWARNGWDSERVRALGKPAGFWFTGGDQVRITRALSSEAAGPSPFLALVRQRLGEGAVVGGTSAGAAVMSRTMITGGNSFDALLAEGVGEYSEREEDESGRVSLAPGLGLLPAGLVDQHFDRRARLGRLVRALAESGDAIGFGVDENTALSVDLATGTGRVLGPGSVTVIDSREAKFDFAGNTLATGIRLGVVPEGAAFSLVDGSVKPGRGKPTRGSEYYGHRPRNGGGMALPNPRLNQLLGNDLLDNRASTRLQRLSCDDRGRGLRYDFSEDERSRGFWFEESPGEAYAVESVRLDIRRVPGACAGAMKVD